MTWSEPCDATRARARLDQDVRPFTVEVDILAHSDLGDWPGVGMKGTGYLQTLAAGH